MRDAKVFGQGDSLTVYPMASQRATCNPATLWESTIAGGIASGQVLDYQWAALLMAIAWRGMTSDETVALVEAMLHSGTVIDLSDIPGPKIDKHSSGGVGDKTSLIVAPIAAACGLTVPMVSGRGLGHTGGTLDKLEAIPGFCVDIEIDRYRQIARECGLVLVGQTARIAPADRVLDVKYGGGAFMVDRDDARALAISMTTIGRAMGKSVQTLLTSMEQPLGRTVGNALEVKESIECLRGDAPG